MGVAAEIAVKEMDTCRKHLKELSGKLMDGLRKRIEYLAEFGHPENRHPGIVSVGAEFVEGESILLFMDMEGGVAIASGSACILRSLKVSHVMLAMGVDHATAQGSLLFSLGKDNTAKEVQTVLEDFTPDSWAVRLCPRYISAKERKNSFSTDENYDILISFDFG